MALFDSFLSPLLAHPFLTILLTPLLYLALKVLYRASPFQPLSHIPSPPPWTLWPITSARLLYHAYTGTECTAVHLLHLKYGSIVRTGPKTVDISDGDALKPIYVEKGGFLKPAFYGNFDIDGHKSIFSAIDPKYRASRAKAVVGMFSTNSLRAGKKVIDECVGFFVRRMKEEAELARGGGGKTNVLLLTRSLALDVVCAYLFGRSYGALSEKRQLVAVGRYWYLPPWLFRYIDQLSERFWGEEAAAKSIEKVDEFVAAVVGNAASVKGGSSGTYAERLLEAGFSESEARAQCKDLIFAGTDSTGMNLATIIFMLAKHPETYGKLKTEVITATMGDDENLQSLPYLRGVVREGLRLSMANPSRLPRVVPSGGWTFKGTFLPAGTEVSCSPFELHLDERIYPDPRAFRPERWLSASEEMNRDHIPFGLGVRQCIARNLASVELYAAVYKLAKEDVLDGAGCVRENLEILEWFNSKVVDETIEIKWDLKI